MPVSFKNVNRPRSIAAGDPRRGDIDESRAKLCGGSAEVQNGGDVSAVHDAAGGNLAIPYDARSRLH
jgi:hypothetical protein